LVLLILFLFLFLEGVLVEEVGVGFTLFVFGVGVDVCDGLSFYDVSDCLVVIYCCDVESGVSILIFTVYI
jgi:hypothetical protein